MGIFGTYQFSIGKQLKWIWTIYGCWCSQINSTQPKYQKVKEHIEIMCWRQINKTTNLDSTKATKTKRKPKMNVTLFCVNFVDYLCSSVCSALFVRLIIFSCIENNYVYIPSVWMNRMRSMENSTPQTTAKHSRKKNNNTDIHNTHRHKSVAIVIVLSALNVPYIEEKHGFVTPKRETTKMVQLLFNTEHLVYKVYTKETSEWTNYVSKSIHWVWGVCYWFLILLFVVFFSFFLSGGGSLLSGVFLFIEIWSRFGLNESSLIHLWYMLMLFISLFLPFDSFFSVYVCSTLHLCTYLHNFASKV